MIRTQIQLTDEQMRKLKSLSRAKGVSAAELVRQAVDKLTSEEKANTREALVSHAKAAAGKFGSGSRDGSEKHDDYFAGTVLS